MLPKTMKSIVSFVFITGFLSSSFVYAQASDSNVGSAQSLVQVFFALVLVVGLIIGLAWLVKWTSKMAGPGSKSLIKVVTQIPIGVKEKLVIVKVSDKYLLLGLTAQNISILQSFDEATFNPDLEIKQQGSELFTMTGNGFQDVLRKMSAKNG